MAIDTFAKRMVVAGVPMSALGPNVFPGTTSTILGRTAAAWNYSNFTPTPPAGGNSNTDKFTVGTKESLGVTGQPTIGGPWSW